MSESIQELKRKRAELDKQIKDAEEAEVQAKIKATMDKVENMSETEKTAILKYIKHDRTSCSDENPCNGIFGGGRFRCRKCALMEILKGYNIGFEFEITAEITKID